MSRPVGACARCGRQRPIQARRLCNTCYGKAFKPWGVVDLADYAPERDFSLEVDEVVVDRAVQWAIAACRTTPSRQRHYARNLPDRPRLSRGEKIAVLRRVTPEVGAWAASRVLGINSQFTRQFLDGRFEGAA